MEHIKTFSIGQLVKESWNILTSNFWRLIGFFLAYTVMSGLVSSFGQQAVVAQIIASLISVFLVLVYLKFMIDTATGKKVSFFNYFDKVKLSEYIKFLLNYFLIGIIAAALVAVALVPTFLVSPWFLLLLIFAVYVFVRLTFAPYFAADGYGPVDAIKQSWHASRGASIFFKLFWFGLVILGINILGLLALVIGVIVSLTLSWIISAKLYNDFAKKRKIS